MLKKTTVMIPLVAAMLLPTPIAGQGLESLGNRASAMAAFVAVADDASAVAWNPAGLVSGPIFNIAIDFGRSTSTPDGPPRAPFGAERIGTTVLAIATTPVGLAYYRLADTTVHAGPAVTQTGDRQDSQVAVRTLVTTHLGATVQQSVGDYLTLGATVKLVRGSVGVGAGSVRSWPEAFERTDALETEGSTTGDVDLGVMFAARRMRAGLVVRNATEPTFRSGGDSAVEVPLQRQTRLGVAWGDGWPGIARLVVAVDADVTRTPHVAGERRDIAAGVERWLRSRTIGVRGGVRASTVGDARPVASAGVSYAVRLGTYVDGYVLAGRDLRGWGIAARVGY